MTGHIRIRDFLNVAIYAKNEKQYFDALQTQDEILQMKSGDKVEIEDGIFAVKDTSEIVHFINDYSKNQFKFMATTEQLNLFCVSLILLFNNLQYYKYRDELFQLE